MGRLRVVRVTQEDIECGRPWRASECPVALAVNRALDPEVSSACVGVLGGVFYDNKKLYAIPRTRVANFVRAYDTLHNETVKPFTFLLWGP